MPLRLLPLEKIRVCAELAFLRQGVRPTFKLVDERTTQEIPPLSGGVPNSSNISTAREESLHNHLH